MDDLREEEIEVSLLEAEEASQLRMKDSSGITYLYGSPDKLLNYAEYWVKGVGANKGNKPFYSEASLWKEYWEEITSNEVNKLELNRLKGLIYYISPNPNDFRFTYHQVEDNLRVVWCINYKTQNGVKVPNLYPLIIIWKGDWYDTKTKKCSELKYLLKLCKSSSEVSLKNTLVFKYVLREHHSSTPKGIKSMDPYTKIWNVNIPSWYDLTYNQYRETYSKTNDLNIGLKTTISTPKHPKNDLLLRVISGLISVSLVLSPAVHQEINGVIPSIILKNHD